MIKTTLPTRTQVMKSKLTQAQNTVLEEVARAQGLPRAFAGPQLRAANIVRDAGLIERKGRGFVLTAAGEAHVREAGWLKPAPPTAPVREASVLDVLNYQLKEQRGRTLRTAELLLEEVTHLVAALRTGAIPTSTINPTTVNFLTGDHAKLVTLHDTIELVKKG